MWDYLAHITDTCMPTILLVVGGCYYLCQWRGKILKLATINSLFVLLYSNTITLVCNVLVQVVTSFVFISVLSGFIPCLFQLLISLNSFDQFKQSF